MRGSLCPLFSLPFFLFNPHLFSSSSQSLHFLPLSFFSSYSSLSSKKIDANVELISFSVLSFFSPCRENLFFALVININLSLPLSVSTMQIFSLYFFCILCPLSPPSSPSLPSLLSLSSPLPPSPFSPSSLPSLPPSISLSLSYLT